jgi:hypothetical protein
MHAPATACPRCGGTVAHRDHHMYCPACPFCEACCWQYIRESLMPWWQRWWERLRWYWYEKWGTARIAAKRRRDPN